MPKRGRSRQSLSLFASLPTDLRHAIRSGSRGRSSSSARFSVEPASALEIAPETSKPGIKILQEIEGSTLLKTQPDSESEDEEDEVVDMDITLLSQDDVMNSEPVPRPVVVVPTTNPSSLSVPLPSAKSPPPHRKSANFEQSWLGIRSEYVHPMTAKQRKNFVKRMKNGKAVLNPHLGHPWDCTGLVPRYVKEQEVPYELRKYYHQRGFLFPDYDRLPLLMDQTGWFSVTPQPIAAHVAQRCQCDVIVDAFCGVGGNAIEFAKTCERVIAIDNDLTRLRLARHNALHHGVADRIEFILGDYMEWARSLSARESDAIDVVFLSPPWGGIDYRSGPNSSYPLSALLPIHGRELFHLTSRLTPNIAYYLPRNTDLQELADLAREVTLPGLGKEKEYVEAEEETVRGKVKALTFYFGGLISDE
ncbi:hypothetical protein I350_04300 [Cryptococcus amylolentus CBS 6273]|uniref:Trimethylguanosine synthase n=1 Tax=Cryptococcus amylolentus CBS 6273 TaxID=1296118 RepID=A0A1E3K1L3_9TREE|nr:hypothetical protein I350_04300 [Cryptococcus amylolentus CBS 6273]